MMSFTDTEGPKTESDNQIWQLLIDMSLFLSYAFYVNESMMSIWYMWMGNPDALNINELSLSNLLYEH